MFTGEIRRGRSKSPFVIAGVFVVLVGAVVALVPLPHAVASTFVLECAATEPVTSPRAGAVAEVVAKPGASVGKDSVLAKFDVAEAAKTVAALEPEVAALEKKVPGKPNAKATAAVKKAEAGVKTATAAMEKAKKAGKGKATPAVAAAEKKLEAAKAGLEKARAALPLSKEDLAAALDAARAKLSAAKAEVGAAALVSPAAGVLKDFSLSVGARLEANAPVARVEDCSTLKARVKVPPGEPLKKGGLVTLTLRQGSKRVIFDADAVGDSATAEFDNSKGELAPGITGKAEVEGAQRSLASGLLGR